MSAPTKPEHAPARGEDLAGKLTAIRDKFLMPTPDKDHTDYAIITRCIAVLSIPTEARVAEQQTWEDRHDEWSDKIRAAHPVNSDVPTRHKTFGTALEMVENRRGKYELIGLVHWLLSRALGVEALTPSEGG